MPTTTARRRKPAPLIPSPAIERMRRYALRLPLDEPIAITPREIPDVVTLCKGLIVRGDTDSKEITRAIRAGALVFHGHKVVVCA